LFTSGPQEAVIQVALTPDAPRGEPLRERLREALRRELPGSQISFEAADIVSQVMSFGSPTPIEVAVQGISLQDDYAYAQKVQGQMAKLSFLRDLQFAQEQNFPTLDITIDRERAGQFGLTMSDVVRSVIPPLPLRGSPTPTIGAIRIPATRFRFKSSCLRTASRASNRWVIFQS